MEFILKFSSVVGCLDGLLMPRVKVSDGRSKLSFSRVDEQLQWWVDNLVTGKAVNFSGALVLHRSFVLLSIFQMLGNLWFCL